MRLHVLVPDVVGEEGKTRRSICRWRPFQGNILAMSRKGLEITLRNMGFPCSHTGIDLSGSLTETTPRRHARCLQRRSVNSSCSTWPCSSPELKPIEAGRADVLHGAEKDRFVACKPHLAEELRVNRGGFGPCEGLSESHSAKRLGCGGFEDQIAVPMYRES
jgi:hypothetical protein